MKPARIEALSDGIFAIVMTLLVLELRVPAAEVSTDLAHSLALLWPKFISFIISFLILGIYWGGHHIQFGFVKRANFNFMWINIIFLLFVSLIPFSTALIGEHPYEQIALVIYGINLIICALILYASWRYARKNALIESREISEELRRNARHKMLLPPTLYFIAILLSFIDTRLSLALFVAGPLIYFIPVSTRVWNALTDPLSRSTS